MRIGAASSCLAGLALFISASASAETVDLTAERTAIERFQSFDQKLQDVGWRLARSNAAFCPKIVQAIGLQLQDVATYPKPERARMALNLSGDFAVQTAAQGSPAHNSGTLESNREISRINGADPNLWPVDTNKSWQRLTSTHDFIDRSLQSEKGLTLTFAGGETASLIPVAICAVRFELAGNTDWAKATSKRVIIGNESPGFSYEEPLFAAMIAHELAHTMLAHSEWLDRNTRKRRNIKATEREADRLMPWLLANAGYDPKAAIAFLETYKPNSGGLLFIPGTHDKWQKRVKAVSAELPLVQELMARDGRADWSVHFRREIEPSQTPETHTPKK